jgi:hypothetical protein
MTRRLALVASVAAAVSFSALGWPLAAAERFDPELHFPKASLLFLRADIGKLRRAFRETPLGALVFHPGVRKALGKLPEFLMGEIRRETAEFERDMGVDLFSFLDYFQGDVAMTWHETDPRNGPRMYFSVELGPKRKEILAFVEKLAQIVVREGGSRSSERVRGRAVDQWNVRYGPAIELVELGDYLVFYVAEDKPGGLKDVVERFATDGKDGLRQNTRFALASGRTAGFTPLLAAYVDLEEVRELTYTMIRSFPFGDTAENERQARSIFEFTGLDKVSTVSYRTGIRDGDWEGKLAIESPGGLSGLLQLLAECAGAAKDPAPLDRMPHGATQVASFSLQPGRLLRETIQGVEARWPQAKGEIEAFSSRLEEALGVSLSRHLYLLPRVDIHAFQVSPPAGGLLGDSLALVKAGEAKPYIALLETMARKTGGGPQQLEVLGKQVEYVRVSGLLSRLGMLPEGFRMGGAEAALVAALMNPALTVAHAPLDDNWLVLGSTPHAVARYLEHYAKGKKLSEDEAVVQLLRNQIGSGAAYVAVRGGGAFLGVYNSLVSAANLAAAKLEHLARPYGIEPAHLPAGEVFASRFGTGFVLLRSDKDSIVLHGHRFFSHSVVSAGALVFGALAGIGMTVRTVRIEEAQPFVDSADEPATPPPAVPATPGGRRMAAVGELLKKYLEATGDRAYPFDAAGSLASFQMLASSGVLDDPEVLVHPLSSETPAAKGGGGEVKLTDANVSYVLVPWKQGPRDNPARILCHEKKAYDRSGRHVLFVDLKVKFLPEDEFVKLLAEQTQRYGKKLAR